MTRVPAYFSRKQGGTAVIMTPSLFMWDGVFFDATIINKKESKNTMDMKERLQELAEAARKRIEESDRSGETE